MTNPANLKQYVANHGDSVEAFEQITTFLRVVFENNGYRLLAFTDDRRTNFFLQEKDGPVLELKCLVYTKSEALLVHTEIMVEPATYRRQLVAIFNREPASFDVNRLAEETDYNEPDLVRFLKKATGYKEPVTKKKDRQGSGIFVIGGLAENKFRVKGDKYENREAGASFNTNVSPLMGVGAVIRNSRNFGKTFLAPQLKFYSYKNQTTISDSYYTRQVIYQSRLVVNLGMNIGFDLIRTRHLRGYIAPGLAFLGLVGNENTNKFLSSSNPTYYPLIANLIKKGSWYSYNANVQAGLNLNNKFLLWASYALPSPAMTQTNKYTHQTIQAGIGYQIFHL